MPRKRKIDNEDQDNDRQQSQPSKPKHTPEEPQEQPPLPLPQEQQIITPKDCRNHQALLPDDIKDLFGTLGFVKWTNCHLPVLVVDPMQLVLHGFLPVGIYHAWWFRCAAVLTDEGVPKKKNKKKNTKEKVPLLVYWYGTLPYELSILRMSDIVPWEEGTKRGWDIFPEFIENRMKQLRPPLELYTLLDKALPHAKTLGIPFSREGRTLSFFLKATTKSSKKTKKQSSSPQKNYDVVLNEWHALALDDSSEVAIWKVKRDDILQYLSSSSSPSSSSVPTTLPSSFSLLGHIAYLPRTIPGPLRQPKKTEKYYHPVMIVGPFRIPSNLRQEWFARCSLGEWVMVYWLGMYTSSGGAMSDKYHSFHRLDELTMSGPGCSSTQEGKTSSSSSLRYDPPVPILLKYDEGPFAGQSTTPAGIKHTKALVQAIDLWVCAVQWELPRALERPPQDRWGGMEDLEEAYDDDFDTYWGLLDGARDIGGSAVLDNTPPSTQITKNATTNTNTGTNKTVSGIDDRSSQVTASPEATLDSPSCDDVDESIAARNDEVRKGDENDDDYSQDSLFSKSPAQADDDDDSLFSKSPVLDDDDNDSPITKSLVRDDDTNGEDDDDDEYVVEKSLAAKDSDERVQAKIRRIAHSLQKKMAQETKMATTRNTTTTTTSSRQILRQKREGRAARALRRGSLPDTYIAMIPDRKGKLRK